MLTLFFFITTVICSVMWFSTTLSVQAIIQYMFDHGYACPDSKELDECIQKVLKRKFPWYSK